MSRTELLAPAGSYEALLAAVQNGCDAVYLGGESFGARAFAGNFNDEELKAGVAYAHAYGVRVFVTVNTLIKETEIAECLRYVERLQSFDVDALIIQDVGLFTLLRKRFPDLELHASTQMHIHNPSGIRQLKKMGAARVVLPRETPIEQIRSYHKEGVDLEVFVQGALCISYSGQCLMSAMTLNRSGNRGECAQSCRMKYQLERTDEHGKRLLQAKGDYLLSPKDLNTLEQISELIEAGVYSFKIEGRMKRPEYVALMVSLYRKAIDAYEQHEPFHVDKAMQEAMQKIFHRGFTSGHLFHQTGSALMNFYRPNHMGMRIGTIEGFHGDKVHIHLTSDLHQGDGIRILTKKKDEGFTVNRIYKDGLLVNHALADEVIALDKTFFAHKGDVVVKTSDSKQLKELQESYAKNTRKVNIYGSFHMKQGAYATLEVMDEEGFSVSIASTMLVDKARTAPLEEARIDQQLRKSKDTPFQFVQISYTLDEDGILPIKEINRMRREALELLMQKRSCRHPNRSVLDVSFSSAQPSKKLASLFVVVHTEEQALACKDAGITMIFVEGSALYQKLEKEICVYERTPRVMKKEYPQRMVMIQENGGVYQNPQFFTDTSLNVTNAHTAAFLFEQGALGVAFSLESSLAECVEIANQYQKHYQQEGNFIYPIYGREELMLSEYCVINAVEKDSAKKDCHLCKNASYALIDAQGHHYPILSDESCRMHILNTQPRDRILDMDMARNHHISSFLCVFTSEDAKECKEVIERIKRELPL